MLRKKSKQCTMGGKKKSMRNKKRLTKKYRCCKCCHMRKYKCCRKNNCNHIKVVRFTRKMRGG